jgi:hypothetical protein
MHANILRLVLAAIIVLAFLAMAAPIAWPA